MAALLATTASAIEADANPMQKIIELLEVLSKEIETEGEQDAKLYEAHTSLYNKEVKIGKAIIKKHADKIAQLDSDLQEAQAFRSGKNKDLVDLANNLAKFGSELESGRSERKKERAAFEENEATFIESVDQLERSLAVMKKNAPVAVAAASSASLISIAAQLKKTLMHNSDFSLSTAQRQILNSFVRTAAVVGDFRNHRVKSFSAPSFLQLRGPYGEYKSNSGGLLATLQDLQSKVEKERDAALTQEVQNKKVFKEFDSGLTTMIQNSTRSLANIKISIAQSQQESSKKQASLMESKEIYKTEIEHVKQVETEYRVRTRAYKVRLGKRMDEAMAVHEAQRTLTGELAKSYIKQQSIGSFLQFSMEKKAVRRKALQVFTKAKTAGLALLALRSTVHFKSGVSADPFTKIKSLIKGMLRKLTDSQAQESKHEEWCAREMGKSTTQKERKEDGVQKMTDRLDALSGELTETMSDMKSVTKDLKDLNASMVEAGSVRAQEHQHATHAIKEYGNAGALLRRGCKLLKAYYNNAAGVGSEVGKKAKQRHGLGEGIISLLEIAIDDFEKLRSETQEAEESAAMDFDQLQEEGTVRTTVFQKDLEWKSRTKVKLEFDESTMKNDLKSYEQELSAINTYLEKLRASCSIKGPSYTEKKAKREAELTSLKEALAYLASSA